MAEVKNYGLSGVHRTLQLGKQGPVLVGNADTDSFSVTLQDAATLTNMSGANATSGTHFITKSQLDAVYTEATFLANVNYNDSSPILLGNISYGTKTIITTFEVTTAFDASAVVTIGDSSDNSLLMSDNYAEIEVPGTYQTVNVVEFANDSTLNIYITQGGATQGAGTVLVSVVDGPVVNGGAINYGAGGGNAANVGEFVFTDTTLTVSGLTNEDMYVKAIDDLFLDALDDDVHLRANDDIRFRTGYDFDANTYTWELRYTDGGLAIFYNYTAGNDYGYIRPVDDAGSLGMSYEGLDDVYLKSNNGNKTWKFANNGDLTLPSGGTIRNSAGNNLLAPGFDTINVGGVQAAIADGTTAFELVAGNGISITSNVQSNQITISADSGSSGSAGYKGFKAHYGRMWDNNDDPNGPINKIVIYKDTVTPSSTIDESTGQDDFTVTGLTGSDIVAMLVTIGENISQTSEAELKTFAESIIDNVILDGGVEGQFNTAPDMRAAFYANYNTFSSVLTDLKQNLQFFDTDNLNYNIIDSNAIINSGSGSGWNWYGIKYNINNNQLEMNSGSTGGPGGFQVGDTLTILGNNLQDYQNNTLSSPANDLVITVTAVDGNGIPQSYSITGTVPYTEPLWPSNYINDGGDDEYDTANYITTNLESQISYNNGTVVSSSSAFGGGDYVVTYRNSIFGVFASDAAIDSIGTEGNSGFDNSGQADTGSLYGASSGSNNTLGDVTIVGTALKTDNGNNTWQNGIISLMPGSNNEPQYATYGQFINIYPTWNYDEPHIHIAAGSGINGTGDMILGDDNYHIDVNHDGQIYIKTDNQNYTWTFGNNGDLTLPNGGTIRNSNGDSVVGLPVNQGGGALNTLLFGGATSANNGKFLMQNINLEAEWSNVDYNNLTNKPTSITSFGITDGTNGQVLTTNGNGTFTFTTISGGGGSSNYADSNVVTLLGSFGSNALVTTGNVTAGNVTTAAGKHVYLGNASSLLRQLGSNSHISLNQNVTLTPDTTASATSGVTIGGSGYILGPNNARNMTLNYGASGIVGFQSNIVLGTAGNASLNVPGITSTGITSIVAGVTNTILPNTIASFSANVNNYTQVTLQNKSTGADATADFIITADNGNDTTNFADFGIINSGYDNTTPSNSLGNIVFAADTYLYAQGNASNTSQPGGNLAIGTTTVGKTVKVFAGGANSNSVIGTFSNTGLVVNGNVTANNFSGNISITGNIAGTSPNVQLVAGNYTATFDNTGVLTLPTIGGNEGGEINFGIAAANTTLTGPVKVDVFQDRIRFFEGSTKGAYIDLSQAGTGVSTLLNNRVSGFVNAGTFVTMDNIKATVTSSGQRGLSLATVSGSFTYNIAGNFGMSGNGSGGQSLAAQTLTTTATSSIFGWGFSSTGDLSTYILTDTTNNRCYRITVQIGSSFNNNSIVIERLI